MIEAGYYWMLPRQNGRGAMHPVVGYVCADGRVFFPGDPRARPLKRMEWVSPEPLKAPDMLASCSPAPEKS